ncbi:UNVERIFIED_CONTAM: 60S ribosomal protein L11-1 [Sesamum radiatum]|uniref:60S ribosomal protein L11-1 n=1 Tax=Sesamum radiatum TaxID=300843 RepID=A0AAW2KIF8_SESRA
MFICWCFLAQGLLDLGFPAVEVLQKLYFPGKRITMQTGCSLAGPASIEMGHGLSWAGSQYVGPRGVGARYDPSTGIYGMDFYVVLERPGYRVGRRRRCKSRVGIQHRVTKDDAMKWFQVKYEGVILNKASNIGAS